MRYSRLSLCLLALLSVAPMVRADESTTDLRCLWQTGQTSRYRTVSTRVTAVQTQGMKEPRSTSLQVKADTSWKVLQANPDGGGTCTMTVEAIEMAVAGPDGKAQIITADKAPENLQPMSQLIKALKGVPVNLTIAPDGRITDASGWQSIKSNAGEAGKNLTEKDFIETASELAPLSGGPASAHDKSRWTGGLDIDGEMGPMHIDSSYQFDGVETMAGVPVAMINRNSQITLTPDPSRLHVPEGASVDIALKKGEMRSQIMFDLTRHEVVGENVDRLEIFLLTYSAQGRTLQQAVQQRYNTQVLRINEN